MLKTAEDIETREKSIVQLRSLHKEISLLSKKAPNDGLNKFKLRFVNAALQRANEILIGRYKPFDEFSIFDEHHFPTNSDVAMIISRYIEQIERVRSDNMIFDRHEWRYEINGAASDVKGRPPTKVGTNR